MTVTTAPSIAQVKFITDLHNQIARHHAEMHKTAGNLAGVMEAEAQITDQHKMFAQLSKVGMTSADASKEIKRLLAVTSLNRSTRIALSGKVATNLDATGTVFVSFKRVSLVKPVLEGAYRIGEDVFSVKKSKTTGRFYANVWNALSKSWDYAPGIMKKIQRSDKMSLSECMAFGIENVQCCVCSRKLTAKASKEAGIGPICASRF